MTHTHLAALLLTGAMLVVPQVLPRSPGRPPVDVLVTAPAATDDSAGDPLVAWHQQQAALLHDLGFTATAVGPGPAEQVATYEVAVDSVQVCTRTVPCDVSQGWHEHEECGLDEVPAGAKVEVRPVSSACSAGAYLQGVATAMLRYR